LANGAPDPLARGRHEGHLVFEALGHVAALRIVSFMLSFASGVLRYFSGRFPALLVDPRPRLVLLYLEGACDVAHQIADQHSIVPVIVALWRMDMTNDVSVLSKHDHQWRFDPHRFFRRAAAGPGQELSQSLAFHVPRSRFQ